jgi:DNA-binding LacI/PurR family transcriptional regulator/DNA-binding transcriptional regulator YhcF (GntR family)
MLTQTKTKRTPGRAGVSVAELSEHLRRLAIERGPNAKLPTQRELCSELKTSSATLYTTLGELEKQNVVYRRHGSGIYVSPRINEKAIALIVGPSFQRARWASPFWDNLLAICIQESQHRVASHNERLTVYITTPSGDGKLPLPENFVGDHEAGRVHGVIGISLDTQSDEWLKEREVPMAAFGGAGWPQVQIDETRLIDMGVRALVEAGCRRVGFWAPNPHDASRPVDPEEIGNREVVARDHAAFAEALAGHGAALHPELIQDNRLVACGQRTNQEQGVEMAGRFLAMGAGERPDGVLIHVDTMTAGVLAALRETGVKIGRDLKIATHANAGTQILYGYEGCLIRVAVDPVQIALELYGLLHVQLHDKPNYEPRLIAPRLL